jgi:hypothetical protein
VCGWPPTCTTTSGYTSSLVQHNTGTAASGSTTCISLWRHGATLLLRLDKTLNLFF